MQKVVSPATKARRRRLASFTLIELLTVITIIAILATLILAAASGLQSAAARKRAQSEISGMSIALENYKKDNGIYPPGSAPGSPPNSPSALLGPGTAGGTYDLSLDPSTTGGLYQQSSESLYTALSGGETTFGNNTPPTGTVYYSFNKKQLGNATSSGPTYVKDPWGFSYGYSTGDALTPQVQYPNNGSGSFDLWTTGGTGVGSTPANATNWISNWQ